MAKSRFASTVLLALLFLSGCGDNAPTLVEVEGTVLLDGKPLEKIRVEFTPLIDGPQSAGLTNDQGKFSLATMTDQKKGAVVGKHKVVLKDLSIVQGEFMGRAGAEVDMTKGQKPRISTKYTNVTLTPLETDVTGEIRDLKFEVEPYKR